MASWFKHIDDMLYSRSSYATLWPVSYTEDSLDILLLYTGLLCLKILLFVMHDLLKRCIVVDLSKGNHLIQASCEDCMPPVVFCLGNRFLKIRKGRNCINISRKENSP